MSKLQSNEEQIENPRYYRQAQKHLAKCQRKAQKVKPQPRNDPKKIKAKKALTRAYNKAANRRKDFQHKFSNQLAKTYSLICVEDLQVKNLLRRPKPKIDETYPAHFLPNGASAKGGLNKSIADAGWSTFINMLAYKVEYTGSKLIKVPAAYTSQVCPNPQCGIIQPKPLDERWHSCECGASMPRDVASAKVILRIGLDSLRNQSVDAPPQGVGSSHPD